MEHLFLVNGEVIWSSKDVINHYHFKSASNNQIFLWIFKGCITGLTFLFVVNGTFFAPFFSLVTCRDIELLVISFFSKVICKADIHFSVLLFRHLLFPIKVMTFLDILRFRHGLNGSFWHELCRNGFFQRLIWYYSDSSMPLRSSRFCEAIVGLRWGSVYFFCEVDHWKNRIRCFLDNILAKGRQVFDENADVSPEFCRWVILPSL